MDLQSHQKICSSPISSPKSMNVFKINKRYPIRVKPLTVLPPSNETSPRQLHSPSENIPTKDTVSNHIEHNEEKSSDKRRGSSVSISSKPNPVRKPLKSILKHSKIGIAKRKSSCSSIFQSFLESFEDQFDPEDLVFLGKIEIKNQASPSVNIRRAVNVRRASVNPSSTKPKVNKKVTFAAKLVQIQESFSDFSDSETECSHPAQKEPTIKHINNYCSTPIKQSTKVVHNFFTFSPEDIAHHLEKEKPSMGEKNSISPHHEHKEPEIFKPHSPIYNLKNRPTETIFNMKLPLVMANTISPKSYQKPNVAPDGDKCITRRYSCPIGFPKN